MYKYFENNKKLFLLYHVLILILEIYLPYIKKKIIGFTFEYQISFIYSRYKSLFQAMDPLYPQRENKEVMQKK